MPRIIAIIFTAIIVVIGAFALAECTTDPSEVAEANGYESNGISECHSCSQVTWTWTNGDDVLCDQCLTMVVEELDADHGGLLTKAVDEPVHQDGVSKTAKAQAHPADAVAIPAQPARIMQVGDGECAECGSDVELYDFHGRMMCDACIDAQP